MIAISRLKTKINTYSLVGALLYGLLCSYSVTEVYDGLVGRMFCFLSSLLFFFVVYVFYPEIRTFMARLWKDKLKYIVLFIGCWGLLSNVAWLIYMYVYRVPAEVAIEDIALFVGNSIKYFFNYMPFLP